MLNVIGHLARKEFIQTFRDKRMLFPIFAAPIIQLILFGYAVTTDIKHTPIAVLDFDQTSASRNFIASFSQTDLFDLEFQPKTYKTMEKLLQKGEIQACLVIPAKFGDNLKKKAQSSLQIILDGTDANSATIILNYISQITGKYSENLLSYLKSRNEAGLIELRSRIWFNPELKSSIYMVPGVICLILLLTTLLLTSMAITKEREMGTIEQLIVSPIKGWELVIGKTIPFVLIGLADITLIILAGKLIFNLPIRGSLLFLGAISLLFIMTTLSLGLFISTVSRTQQQAMMSAFFFIVPAMLLSGIFSPIESMPQSIQYITLLNPLRYFSQAVRGILLKGNDFSILWPQVLALFVFGLAALFFSSLRFKKRLE